MPFSISRLTLGRGSHRENVVAPGGIPIFEVERGGDVTYHGPGQLVGYPILDLRDWQRDVGAYVRAIEQTIIKALATMRVTTIITSMASRIRTTSTATTIASVPSA